MVEKSMEHRVKVVLTREAMVERKPQDIDDKAKLIDELGLDSVQIVELIAGLEDEFGITVEDEELNLELFESVDSIAAFLRKKTHKK
jgi:acyl carrier protein